MTEEPYRIDVHNHILPNEYLSALNSVGIDRAAGVNFPRWDVESSLKFMDAQKIATTIVSISSPGIYFKDIKFAQDLASKCNNIAANLISKHPSRFGAFAVLPLPDVEASILELERALDELKLDGVGLLSSIDEIYLGDPVFEDLYSELNRRKAVVFVHPNTPPDEKLPNLRFRAAMLEFVFDTTRAATNLAYAGVTKRYPDIRFILPHAGGTVPYLAWRISFGKRKILDSLKSFYYDTAVSGTSYALNSLSEFIEPSHILFGCDYPFLPERMIDTMIKGLKEYEGFDEKTRKMIERENALTLFPRLNQYF
jgi:predicted TIM-barrel fold metal-dependent hydrolase